MVVTSTKRPPRLFFNPFQKLSYSLLISFFKPYAFLADHNQNCRWEWSWKNFSRTVCFLTHLKFLERLVPLFIRMKLWHQINLKRNTCREGILSTPAVSAVIRKRKVIVSIYFFLERAQHHFSPQLILIIILTGKWRIYYECKS